MANEFDKLLALLDEAKIPYDRGDDNFSFGNIRRVFYPNSENLICSAISGFGTYGGDEGLLEISGLLTDEEAEERYESVVGHLTADNVFARIKADWKRKGGRGV